MRKLLLLCAAMSINAEAQANRGNLYVGPFVGMGITDGKFKTNSTTATVVRNNRIGDKGFLGGLLLGYAYPCNKLFMGFEISGNFDTTKDKIIKESDNNSIESFELKHRSSYGFAARFGYRTASDTVFFARLGGEWSTYKLSYKALDIGAVGAFNPGFILSASKSKTKFSFVPGIGIEAPIAGKWRARIEAKYSLPQKISVRTGSAPLSGFTFVNTNARVRVGQTSVVLGATYSF